MNHSKVELLNRLHSLDEADFHMPDEMKIPNILRDMEIRAKKVTSELDFGAKFGLVLSRPENYQDGSLCYSFRVFDNDLMPTRDKSTNDSSIKYLVKKIKSQDNAKVLDVLFSKFGLVTVLIYDQEGAKDIVPDIERVLLESDFDLVDYPAIRDLEYNGRFHHQEGITWFERYFSDVFY